MQDDIKNAVKQICAEKGINLESVIETIKAALAAAYRKDFGDKNQNIKVEYDLDTGKYDVYDIKTAVKVIKGEEDEEFVKLDGADLDKSSESEEKEEMRRFNPKTDIPLEEAKKIKKNIKVGDEIKTKLEVPEAFGRMAAQTAKQVIIQKLREAERDSLFDEFKAKEGEIIIGVVQRREGNSVLVDLGRLTAILPREEQIENERYNPGERIKVYVVSVEKTTKGPQVLVSRSRPEIVQKLFNLEIPEIASGVIEIKSIAREAGFRSKVAVETKDESIDPIGSCVGQRGARVQTIINELGGEKIDIIEYDDDPAKFIANALSPANISDIKIKEDEKVAYVTVKEDQLSLAIGKAGQNVRLAAKLTGWKINIIEEKTGEEIKVDNEDGNNDDKNKEEEKETKKSAEKKAKKSAGKETKKSAEKKVKKSAEKATKKSKSSNKDKKQESKKAASAKIKNKK